MPFDMVTNLFSISSGKAIFAFTETLTPSFVVIERRSV